MTTTASGIRRLNHVAILTRSIERSVDHYVALLGVERPEILDVDRPGVKLRTTMVRTGPDAETSLQLIQPEVGPGVEELERGGDGTLYEIAFEVDDIGSTARSYRADGIAQRDLLGREIDSEYLTAASGSRYFYVPPDATLGTRTEILEPVSSASRSAPSPAGRFEGQVVLVTGGASGIGEAVVRSFVEAGAKVAIVDLQADRAEAVASELGPERSLAVAADVTYPAAVRSAVATIIDAYGGVDVAVNCAGLNRFAAPEAIDDEMWRRLVAINLDGPWNVCSAVMPGMIARRKGRIVNVSSVAGVLGIPKAAPYAAGKHGVVGLTRALAIDLGQYGITVNCVAPGTTLTPLVEAATSPTFKAEASRRTLLGRLGTPEDIAAAILFLASDSASWITGVVLPVDGGMTASIRSQHWE